MTRVVEADAEAPDRHVTADELARVACPAEAAVETIDLDGASQVNAALTNTLSCAASRQRHSCVRARYARRPRRKRAGTSGRGDVAVPGCAEPSGGRFRLCNGAVTAP